MIATGLKSERRLRAIEFMPGDRRVVRAAFFTVQETGLWIGSWTPWYGFLSLPKDAAFRLPAGSHITAEIHYRGVKERVTAQGTLGLFFADGTTKTSVTDIVVEAAAAKRAHAETRLAANTRILALRPELQPGIKTIEVSARKPDGSTQVLLFARDIPLDWPAPYILKEPVLLPKGTVVSMTAYLEQPRSSVRVTLSSSAGNP